VIRTAGRLADRRLLPAQALARAAWAAAAAAGGPSSAAAGGGRGRADEPRGAAKGSGGFSKGLRAWLSEAAAELAEPRTASGLLPPELLRLLLSPAAARALWRGGDPPRALLDQVG
jgi:hypothetical protein